MIVAKRQGDNMPFPVPARCRFTEEKGRLLAELRAALMVAEEKNVKHLESHHKLQEATIEAEQAQAKVRAAVRSAASAEEEAISATYKVRQIHLALGAVNIGM